MQFVDLSHRLHDGMAVFPGDEAFSLLPSRTLEQHHYSAWHLSSGMHVATHLDVPRHLLSDPRNIADFPLERFLLPGMVLDCRDQDPILINESDLAGFMPGMALLLYTGWDIHFGEPLYFDKHPELSAVSVAKILALRPGLVGVDLPSPDRSPFSAHKRLLREDILILENLRGLGQLLGCTGFRLAAFPLNLEAEASLVRAVALID